MTCLMLSDVYLVEGHTISATVQHFTVTHIKTFLSLDSISYHSLYFTQGDSDSNY